MSFFSDVRNLTVYGPNGEPRIKITHRDIAAAGAAIAAIIVARKKPKK